MNNKQTFELRTLSKGTWKWKTTWRSVVTWVDNIKVYRKEICCKAVVGTVQCV